jgi:phosphoribosylaminoimidazole-succinocarboxamide synthase
MASGVLLASNRPGKVHEGKVRELYELSGDRLLMVATDRISAFDVVMNEGIPRKGEVLTRISAYWFDRTSTVVPNHMVAVVEGDNAAALGLDPDPALVGRSMVVRRAQPLPVECIVRGYLAGSAWKEYRESGTMFGVELTPGLLQCQQLFEPMFTPTTKATAGHDEPMTYEQLEALVGRETANVLKLRSLALYRYAAGVAEERGIIIADTKFEFGMLDGEVTLIDECVTPDSSRFWPADQYRIGRDQPSFDKQPVRDYLDGLDWNKQPPPPPLPEEVVRSTGERYVEAYRRLTGGELPPPAA